MFPFARPCGATAEQINLEPLLIYTSDVALMDNHFLSTIESANLCNSLKQMDAKLQATIRISDDLKICDMHTVN